MENNTIVASSGLCFYQLPPNFSNPSGRNAYVTNMFTLKEYRKRGLASTLLEKILSEARSFGYSVVRLHASSDGEGIYLRFGFIPSDGYMELRF
ncbi:MAG: GNAT family N-acetyltransferase [Eubacteriaceae bacterium]